ncbi:MAG: hypothetical protein H0T62_05680 [Parachlamydiaceae bacterium]|nr:hypothetical protein [Parachlamydiaceae bacterium]
MAHQHNFEDKIEKIEKVADKSAAQDLENFEPETRLAPNREHFDSLMTNRVDFDVGHSRKVSSTENTSLVSEVSKIERMADQAQRSKPQELIAQAQEAITKISELKEKLRTPDLEIKKSIQTELSNKLSHIDDNLRVAMSKTGVEYTPPVDPGKSQSAIDRFFGLLTDGQEKLNSLTNDISRMDAAGTPFSPATMIVLQVKVGAMQQEIEFFTALLNKALESTKTIMNVQV